MLADLGMHDEARRELAHIRSDGLEPLRESLWLATLTYLADASAAVGDTETAAIVYPELEVYRGTNVQIGHLVACYGAADRYLGMLATVLGDWERAEEHFEAALALNETLGARTWSAHTSFEYARMLLARGARGRSRACRGAPRRALSGSPDEIGLPTVTANVAALGEAVRAARRAPGRPHRARGGDSRELVARGLSNRQIGQELFISEHTAANHIRSILRKTQWRTEPRPQRTLTVAASSPRLVSSSRAVRSSRCRCMSSSGRFAEQLDLTADDVKLIESANADEGVSWFFSFLSADRRRTYCLYEAPSPDAIVAAARRANVPVDSIVEVSKLVPAEYRCRSDTS